MSGGWSPGWSHTDRLHAIGGLQRAVQVITDTGAFVAGDPGAPGRSSVFAFRLDQDAGSWW